MKVAILVWRFPVLSEPFILNQITGLLEREHTVDIYAMAVDRAPAETAKCHPDVEKYQLLEHTIYAPQRPQNSVQRSLHALGLFLLNFPKKPAKVWELSRSNPSLKPFYRGLPFLERPNYDIIHCQFGTLGLIGLNLKQMGIISGKLVTTFRGIDISRYIQEQGEEVYRELFAQGDYFLANCEFFRQKALNLGCNPAKIEVHGSGIDCAKFPYISRTFPPDGVVRLAITGRLVRKKGIEDCLRAVAILRQFYPHLELKIIGDGELRAELTQLIRELNLASVVELMGWKQQEEIIQILARCHIFLAPSVTAADGNQDAPVNTLKEAMAMGLPVISTWHGGIPELVEDGVSGFLVPEKDAEAIAQKLLYLIHHPEIWGEMGVAGRKRVEEKYDKEKLNDDLVNLYTNLSQKTPILV